jgi:hypothetical protein
MRCSSKHIPLSFLAIALLIVVSLACNPIGALPSGGQGQPTQPPAAQPTQAASQPTAATLETVTDSTQLTKIVQDIVKNPKNYEGQQVTVVGYYRGWDLLHEANTAPPVTRSDWVIKDASGAIYCVSVPGGAETVASFRLDPASKADTNKILRLTGAVRTKEGRPYIEYTRIELVQ